MTYDRLSGIFGVYLLAAVGATAGILAQGPPNYDVRLFSPAGDPASEVTFSHLPDPRGEWIVFVGDVELSGAEAVYAQRRNGSDLHRLSVYAPLGTIGGFLFAADGRRVLYLADLDVDGLDELWSVEPWSSAASAIKLNVPVTGAGVLMMRASPVGDRVAYAAETASGVQVWSVSALGPAGSATRLDPSLEGGEIVQTIFFRPDGQTLVLQFTDLVAHSSRVLSVPSAGPSSAAVLLAEGLPGACLPFAADYVPDSSRLVYASFCPAGADYVLNQIWSVPAAGPATSAVSLAGSFVSGGQVKSLHLSADSQWLVFNADRLVDERFELWSVPVAGPAAALVRLNPTLVTNGDVLSDFRLSPDSTRVAYIADQASDERYFPYSVPIAGPSTSAVSLYSGPLAVAADVTSVEFTPDSSKILFRFDLAVDERYDLYWAPFDASSVQTRITNKGGGPARWVSGDWWIDGDGDRVIYVYDETSSGDRRGLGEQRILTPYTIDAKLNGTPVSGGQVTNLHLYPDGEGLLYRSDEIVNDKYQLFTVDLRRFGDGFEEGSSNAWPDTP